MNRIHCLLNESPYEKHTFRDLVSLILTLDREKIRDNDFGCLLSLLPVPFYLVECIFVWETGGGFLQPYISPWLGLVLFPLQYFWAWLWYAVWPGC